MKLGPSQANCDFTNCDFQHGLVTITIADKLEIQTKSALRIKSGNYVDDKGDRCTISFKCKSVKVREFNDEMIK